MSIGIPRSARSANGAPSINVILPPKGEPRVEEPPAEKSAMEKLFEQLGDEDRINVHRIASSADGGGEKYIGVLVSEPGVLDNIEETVALRFGGGRYRLVGRHKGNTVGSAYIHIDEQAWPPKPREAVRAETMGQPQPAPVAAPAPLDAAQLLKLLEEREERMFLRMQATFGQRSSDGDRIVPFIATMLDNQTAIAREAIISARQPAAAASSASGDPLAQITRIADVATKLGWAPPGQGGGDNPQRNIGETLLLRVADRAGEVMAKVAEKKFLETPATAQPTASPEKRIDSPAPVHVPGEARLLSEEAVKRLREQRARASTPAPSATDVLPQDKR